MSSSVCAVRLTLLGGSAGFLAQMEADGVRPDLKSYTQLLSMLPDTLTAEQVRAQKNGAAVNYYALMSSRQKIFFCQSLSPSIAILFNAEVSIIIIITVIIIIYHDFLPPPRGVVMSSQITHTHTHNHQHTPLGSYS